MSETTISQQGRVLLADVEETFLLATEDLLRGAALDVDIARCADGARDLLAADHNYDVLVADIKMPGNPSLVDYHSSLEG